MILSPCSPYLLFGVCFDAPSRNITFYENGAPLLDIDVCIAAEGVQSLLVRFSLSGILRSLSQAH